ncbi:MAG: sigma-54-dependent Fis family transcriptional regulator [Calditrichaeota bacterium]|nr:MAG: sigma-54-dependent Fis family transcriptional regulator [Calditrichota bacterium]MBL1203862.1 sigma-54-dependent Fis family transcriptional regulator [Calditrichota bacterium]NOG43694.1 sigma-54-dependent Fis family transcriptional regulator [Calditrichota bacterium]
MNSASLKDLQKTTGFLGNNPQIDELLQTVKMVAPTELSVLINGESGTGKEVIANAIHSLSLRKNRQMVSVNCGAIPEGILESELFGHEKGSFTGAIGQKKGYFEVANKGTIFLDEIGEMPLNTQVKLLRVLESSEFMRVGGTETNKVDVRVIAATNKNLEQAVHDNEFRRDLYFRLKAITVEIPPLRKRKDDIQGLVSHFAQLYAEKNDINFKGFSPDAVDELMSYNWPGNVRELRNFVETSIILNRGEVVRSDYVRTTLNLDKGFTSSSSLPIPLNKTPDQAERELIYRMLMALKLDMDELKQMISIFMQNGSAPKPYPPIREDSPLGEVGENEVKPTTLSGMEREMIKETLNKYAGSRRKTARALQISERTLYRKINEYGL